MWSAILPFPGIYPVDNQIFRSVQYVQNTFVKQLQEFDTKPPMLLMYAIAVVLSDLILKCLQSSHEFLYAMIAR